MHSGACCFPDMEYQYRVFLFYSEEGYTCKFSFVCFTLYGIVLVGEMVMEIFVVTV